MHCYESLDAAAVTIVRRNPRWLTELPIPELNIVATAAERFRVIARAICIDRPDTLLSDRLVRELAILGRTNSDAMTLLLAAMSRKLRYRLRIDATEEYHADGLGYLTILMINADLDQPRVVGRMVNRAHTHIWKAAHREKVHGRVNPVVVDACAPETLCRYQDRRSSVDDVADRAVRNADLVAFARHVAAAADEREVPPSTWVNYRDFHLTGELIEVKRSASDRVRAHRAIVAIQPFIEQHLVFHAA